MEHLKKESQIKHNEIWDTREIMWFVFIRFSGSKTTLLLKKIVYLTNVLSKVINVN